MTYSVAIIGTRGYPSYYGGFETAVRKLAPYLVDAGWDVTVYGRRETTAVSDADRDHRVLSIETRGIESKSLSTLSYGLTACLHAAWHKPDVALVMNVANGFWLPILRLRGIPVIVNVDGIEWERAKWGRTAKTIFKVSARLTAFFASQLISDAHEIRRRWQVGFGRDSLVIPYGGDVPGALAINEGLSDRSYVLIVARFVPENTIQEFFEAVELLPEEIPVVIVGSSGYGGELDDRAERLAATRPNVRWLGHVSDDQRLLSLWQHCGAYFHGHSVGGTNPALVQAMACGAPVVARDTVYNREVLAEGAVFVEPRADAIAHAISELLENSRDQQELSANSVSRATTHYSWELVCNAYDRALRDTGSVSSDKQEHASAASLSSLS